MTRFVSDESAFDKVVLTELREYFVLLRISLFESARMLVDLYDTFYLENLNNLMSNIKKEMIIRYKEELICYLGVVYS